MADPRHDLGERAEELVAKWLTDECRWRVLARRWRGATGELDLVCLDPLGTLVCVEVRARRTARSGGAEESIDARHLGRLRRALVAFAVAQGYRHRALRIDMVSLAPSADDASRWRLRRVMGIDQW